MTIWKFPLKVQDEDIIIMPQSAAILCVQVQHGKPFLWAVVDETAPTELRRFYIRGTGHEMDASVDAKYIGTIQLAAGNLVFHVFNGGKVAK